MVARCSYRVDARLSPMGRASFPARVWASLKFIVCYVAIFVFQDLPRILFQKPKNVEGQVIVITGGAMGIGKEVAVRFATDLKAKVVIFDVNEKEGQRTVEEILAAGGYARFYKVDISQVADLEKARDDIYNDPKLGFVDMIMCNAAILKFGELTELSYADYALNNNININGHIYTVKCFLPKMAAENRGQIISIGSICSHYGEHYGTAYCAAKFACRGFMESLQMELFSKGLDNIVITSIYPYFVRTKFISNIEEPYSTYFDVVPVEKCATEIVDSILKNRREHYIPTSIGMLCVYMKCLVTKGTLPFGKKIFAFTIKPKAATPAPKESEVHLV